MPDNIRILADWGLARLLDDTMPPRNPNGWVVDGTSLIAVAKNGRSAARGIA